MENKRKTKKHGRSSASREQKRRQYPKDWMAIKAPDNLDEMFENWANCEEPNVGWCLLCNSPIRTVADLIGGTNTHNCDMGRALEVESQSMGPAETGKKAPGRRRDRQSRSSPPVRDPSPEPHVGIFWLQNDRLITDTTPLSQAERYGDSLIHGKGHADRWAELQAAGTVPLEVEYDEVPRGRATYDAVHDQFFVFSDRCISKKAIRQVVRDMRLPKSKTIEARDLHYRCPRCLASKAL